MLNALEGWLVEASDKIHVQKFEILLSFVT